LDWWGASRRARADARHLRDLYGDRAEAWCEGALAGLPRNDPRRRSVQLIAQALRELSATEGRAQREAPRPRPAIALRTVQWRR
jgi:hypothetical protein